MTNSPKKDIKTITRAIQDVGTLLPIIHDVHNYLRENDPFQAKILLEKNLKIIKDLGEIKVLPIINKEQKELIGKIQSLYAKMIKEVSEEGSSKLITISEFEGTLEALKSILNKAA